MSCPVKGESAVVDYERCEKSAEYIRRKSALRPKTALILGSGLGAITGRLTGAVRMPYAEIPGFAPHTNTAHEGALYAGMLGTAPVYALSGRYHYYEGFALHETAFPVGVMKLLGVERLIITNAAGGINKAYSPGELVLIRDHIKFFTESPLRGNANSPFGDRFFDMSDSYSAKLRETAHKCVEKSGFSLREGVYAYMPGPQYETPAEIRMLRTLGADLVGMSTVAEVIMAAHCGIPVLGISCVTNMAAGILDQKITDEEVIETAAVVAEKFMRLVEDAVCAMEAE